MKKYKINIIILICVSLLIMFLIMKDNFNEIIDNLLNANIFYLFLALIFMILSVLFQSFSMHLYLKELDKNYKFKDTFILMFSALFFNAITPFSSGGQPFQVYLLNKQGIKISESTNALLQNFLSYQLALITLGTIAIIINHFIEAIPNTSLLRHIVIIGFIVNVIVLALIIYLGKAKNLNTKMFNKIFNFIFSLKFIKNREVLKEKANKKIDEFYESGNYFKNNKYILLKAYSFNLVSLIILYIIPMFIFFSIKVYDVNVIESIVCSSYTYFVGSFVPIPGGTGGLEYAFIEFFRVFSSSALISTCMILWRFVTYYLSMILGSLSLVFVKKVD